jgi:hypothetical protein
MEKEGESKGDERKEDGGEENGRDLQMPQPHSLLV